jgi:hypothetical protein
MQMVNTGFPAPTRYGFEMVDVRGAALSTVKPGINRKFTPNQMIRIFREFSAI